MPEVDRFAKVMRVFYNSISTIKLISISTIRLPPSDYLFGGGMCLHVIYINIAHYGTLMRHSLLHSSPPPPPPPLRTLKYLCINYGDYKGFFQLEIIINGLVSTFRFI